METFTDTLSLLLSLALGVVAILLYLDRSVTAKAICRLYPGRTKELRASMVKLLESKIEVHTDLHGLPLEGQVTKVNIRETEPSQFQDEDIYVRAYRELVYVVNFDLDIIEPLNSKLVEKGIEVYQYYLCRDSKGVYLVFELRVKPPYH